MTMPSPRRLARRSVALLIRQGMPKQDAARLVTIICDEVTAIIWRRDPDMDLAWLANVAAEAYAIQRDAAQVTKLVQRYSDRVADWAHTFDRLAGGDHDAEAVYDSAYPVVARLLDQATDTWRQRHPQRPGS